MPGTDHTPLAMGQGKGGAVWVVQQSLCATSCVSLSVFRTSGMHLLVEFRNRESMFFLVFLSYPGKRVVLSPSPLC